MSVRETGKKNKDFPMALPVYSIDRKEDAEMLQAILCRVTQDGRNVLTKWSYTGLEYEDLEEVGDYLDAAYRKFILREEIDFKLS